MKKEQHMRATTPRKSLGGRLTVLAIILCVAYALAGILFYFHCPSARMLLYVMAGIAMAVAIWLWSKFWKKDEQHVYTRLFPLVFLVAGFGFLLFFGPNTTPDDRYHYGHTYGYMNLITPGVGEHEVRVEDQVFTNDPLLFSRTMTADSLRAQGEQFGVFATHEGTVEDDTLARSLDASIDLPYIRLPGALGMLIAKMLNLSGIMMFYVGRVFCFLFNAALVIAAVRLTPFGKNILMAIALLPMSLALFSSYSYDGPYLGIAMLTLALIMRVAFAEDKASTRLLVSCVVACALLAPCKVIYTALLFPALFIPKERFASKKVMICWKIGIVAAPIAMLLLLKLSSIARIAGATEAAVDVDVRKVEGLPDETGQFYTLGDLIKHPLSTAHIIVRTVFEQGYWYMSMLVGGTLGQLQAELHMQDFQVFGYWCLLGLAATSSLDDKRTLPLPMRLACIVAFLLSSLASIVSLLTSWTFAGDSVVSGVQGRYFLPVMPALLMGIKGDLVRVEAKVGTAIILCMGSFSFVCIAQMLFFVLGGFSAA